MAYGGGVPVKYLDEDARGTFITRTYVHLFGAVSAFTLILIAAFRTGLAEQVAHALLGVSWMLVLGAFVLVSWLASKAAHTVESRAGQYAALAAYVVAEALVFVPILYIAMRFHPGVIRSAAQVTLVGFLGLTAIAHVTRKDFSFLRSALIWGGFGSLVLIFASIFFGLHLGTFFSVGMVVLAGASILYDTSNILHHYPEDRYVAASLELFASVALMFWYVLRLFMSRDRP